ncbi:hypothetical protein [Thalassobius sp. I31.1]|uniref:hypothetical protein n=1 Tax=Thalassobius sp. I31.1 TaxID=2109912 RepID=UPI000D1B5F08|nr:hypothetical protein [Thalassobius sp. I31.1]
MPDPHAAYFAYATTIAMKAKCGAVTIRDRLGFATRTLDWCGDDGALRGIALEFLERVDEAPAVAGALLLNRLADKFPSEDVQRIESVMGEIETERRWQDRADLK